MLQIRCKNNNITKSFPEGTSLLEVYQEFADELKMPYPVVSAKVNNVSQGLKFRLYQNRDVEFLDARVGSGHSAYVRSLCFILYKATQDLFPGSKLFIEHTISRGYYCNFKKKGNIPLTNDDVTKMRNRMQEIIDLDMPFRRNEATTEEALRVFQERGFSDKVKLLETSGQIAAGGSGSPFASLFSTGGSGSSGVSGGTDAISQLLGAFLSGGGRSVPIDGLDKSNIAFMGDSSISDKTAAEYIALNHFDVENLTWTQYGSQYKMTIPDEQWALVHSLDLNMFYDDGEGYLDLGLDNVYTFDNNGDLVADTSRNWLAIDGHTIAYYHTDTVENEETGEFTITGYVPAYLNNERVNLILIFDSEEPNGYIAGAEPAYGTEETETVAKSIVDLNEGDKIDFICDYYSYDGEYTDTYYLGETLTYSKDLKISNTDVGKGEVRLMYHFTDIYNQEYWSEPIIK